MIRSGQQNVTQAEIDGNDDVLKYANLTEGRSAANLEGVMKHSISAQHAVAVNIATSSLLKAHLAVELESKDLLQ